MLLFWFERQSVEFWVSLVCLFVHCLIPSLSSVCGGRDFASHADTSEVGVTTMITMNKVRDLAIVAYGVFFFFFRGSKWRQLAVGRPGYGRTNSTNRHAHWNGTGCLGLVSNSWMQRGVGRGVESEVLQERRVYLWYFRQ